jgi:putative nucleotidyltransferase with HDIG domain
MINREEALHLLKKYIKNERMINHCLASEAVMRAVANRLGRDADKWGLAGLLHDIDSEVTKGDPKTHALEAINILTPYQLDPDILNSIKMHNECASGMIRSQEFEYALAASETITGLIVATALVYPDKKVASVKTSSVVKRMKEKAFAASVRRESIMECEKIGLSLEEFTAISIDAMKGIAGEIGL